MLPSYTHRSFRRLFITRAIELGVDVKVVAEWQGHKDGGKLMLGTYSHVNRVHSQRMVKIMVDGSRGVENVEDETLSRTNNQITDIEGRLEPCKQKLKELEDQINRLSEINRIISAPQP